MTFHLPIKVVCFQVLAILVGVSAAQASVSLSVVPTEGGSGVRFGRVDSSFSPAKEVRVRVTSTEASQYQVYQRIVEPLTNERGQTVERSVIEAGILDGSNASGTVYLDDQQRLSYTNQLIYTSDQSGTSDSFSVLYKVNSEELSSSGQFIGKILFTVRSVDAASQDEKVMDVYLESGGALTFEAFGSYHRDSVTVRSYEEEEIPESVQLAFVDNRGAIVEIYQEVLQSPVDEAFEPMDLNDILVLAQGSSTGGIITTQPFSFEAGQQRLYSSQAAEDQMTLSYSLKEDAQIKSGVYQGQVRYSLKAGGEELTEDLTLKVDVPAVFKMVIDGPEGGLDFPDLLPTMDPETRVMDIEVQTNLGRPYMVTQQISGVLTNETGAEFDRDSFEFMQELHEKASGRAAYPQFRSVPDSEVPVFYSDKLGASTSFRMIYRLSPYADMEPGGYRTAITLSLSEI